MISSQNPGRVCRLLFAQVVEHQPIIWTLTELDILSDIVRADVVKLKIMMLNSVIFMLISIFYAERHPLSQFKWGSDNYPSP